MTGYELATILEQHAQAHRQKALDNGFQPEASNTLVRQDTGLIHALLSDTLGMLATELWDLKR